VAEPKKEEAYWREQHAKQRYADKDLAYEHYAPVYRTGIKAAEKYPGKPFEEIEDEVALDYERNEAGSALPWDHARHAVHAAWAKLSGDVRPRNSQRILRLGAEQPLIGSENIFVGEDKNHLVDLVLTCQKIACRCHSNLSRFWNRVAIGTATDRGEGD
jgi:hypothetical protein